MRWKHKVYKQLFYVTDCDKSPNLLSHDACYTLGVLKPFYTVEKQLGISENSTHSTQSQVTPIHASKSDTRVGNSFLHQKMKGTVRRLSNNSTQHSISKEQLQGSLLTKQDILDVYVDIFTRIGKFPGLPYKFQLKPNAKPTRHAPRKVSIHLQEAFHEDIRNLETLGIVIVKKKLQIDSHNSHSPGHAIPKKLRICLDLRDLNEALEQEP